MSQIINAADVPLNRINGTVPDVSGAMQSYFQSMTFVPLMKTVVGFQVVEGAAPIEFFGVIFPFSPRQLQMLPEGERKWSWYSLFATPGIQLGPDDCVLYLNVQYRVMSKKNYTLYGYDEYSLIQDYEGQP